MPAIHLPLDKVEPAESEARFPRQGAAARPARGAFPLAPLCRAVSSVGGGFILGSSFGTLAGVGGALVGASLLLLSERQLRRSA